VKISILFLLIKNVSLYEAVIFRNYSMQIKTKEFFYISNLLSISRILLIIPIVWLLSTCDKNYNVTIILLTIIAAITDFLDGYLSRKLNIVTELGIILDPIADKVAMAAILLALIFYREFPVSLVVFLLYRDLLIILIGVIVVKQVEKPIMANFWGKLNSFLFTLLVLVFLFDVRNYLFTILFFVCFLSVIISGISYAKIGERILCGNKTKKIIYWLFLVVLTSGIAYFSYLETSN